jgi:hypothetical protein
LKREYSGNTTVFKNLRGQSWKDVLVGFDPVRDYLNELQVRSYAFGVLI